MDVIVVATEAIYSMETSKEKVVFIKLDMAKAYVLVNWSFLHKVFKIFGVKNEWIMCIMICVTSSYSIIINSDTYDLFNSSFDLQQVVLYHLKYLY